MTADAYGQWIGTPMDDGDIDELLVSAGWGVVSLADGDVPYSLPVSFGYDGRDVYFGFLRTTPDNTKFEFVADGKTARLLVTDVRGRFDWQSVAVTGPVRRVEPGSERRERLLETLDENGWFTSGFERAEGVEEVVGWRLDPEEVRGLEVRPDGG